MRVFFGVRWCLTLWRQKVKRQPWWKAVVETGVLLLVFPFALLTDLVSLGGDLREK